MDRTRRRGESKDLHGRCGQPSCGHIRIHHATGRCIVAGCDCDFWLEWVRPRKRTTTPAATAARPFDQEEA